MNTRQNWKIIILGFLLFLNILAVIAVFGAEESDILKVNFFDIGQGDAIFVISPQNHQILIDGGPGPEILEKLANNMPFWDRTIDLVVLTHPDKDHLAGLVEVLETYRVENILWTGALHNTLLYQEWIKLLDETDARIMIAEAGQRINLISNGNQFLYMDIFYPLENVLGLEQKKVNDASMVAKLVFNNNTFLLTGDITSEAEKELMAAALPLQSDVLKVAHHGSKYSTDEVFLEKVDPEFAVIQVGKNSYGHPTNEVLERLAKFGINVFRNDLDGDIKFFSDGENLNVKTEKHGKP